MALTTSFSLRTLLLAFAVIACAMGIFGPKGLLLGIAIVGVVAYCQADSVSGCGCVAAAAVPLVIGLAFVAHSVMQPSPRSLRSASWNNLRQISLALHNYEQTYGTLPPAYVPGPDGKPWHSWRVLILPFLERQDLYQAYDFNEPWNGPNNSKLQVRMGIYVNPVIGHRDRGKGTTSYFAVVGPRTVWPGAEPRRTDDIPDGAENTILLVETGETDVSWMEPRDLDYDQLVREGFRTGGERSNPHPYSPGFPFVCKGGEVFVAMADGSPRSLDWELPGDALPPLLTVDGGEQVDLDALAPVRPRNEPDGPLILACVALLLFTMLFCLSTNPRPANE